MSQWNKGRDLWIKLLHELSLDEAESGEDGAEDDLSTAAKDEL